MKYWLDTEFVEDGTTIDLLSIGIVAEDGRELYVQSVEAKWLLASEWVKENVLPHMQPCPLDPTEILWKQRDRHINGRCVDGCPWDRRLHIANRVRTFCDPETYGKPEFWAYYADYDWVALCQLFGRMVDLPKGFPMYCRDIKQWCDDLGNPKLPEQGKGEHHALADARWNKAAWEFLADLSARRS